MHLELLSKESSSCRDGNFTATQDWVWSTSEFRHAQAETVTGLQGKSIPRDPFARDRVEDNLPGGNVSLKVGGFPSPGRCRRPRPGSPTLPWSAAKATRPSSRAPDAPPLDFDLVPPGQGRGGDFDQVALAKAKEVTVPTAGDKRHAL